MVKPRDDHWVHLPLVLNTAQKCFINAHLYRSPVSSIEHSHFASFNAFTINLSHCARFVGFQQSMISRRNELFYSVLFILFYNSSTADAMVIT